MQPSIEFVEWYRNPLWTNDERKNWALVGNVFVSVFNDRKINPFR